MTTTRKLLLATAAAATPLHHAHAAGGHHAVDDAALLDTGQCQIETWFDRETAGARTLLHAGPACRVGAVELGLNLDRARTEAAGTTTTAGLQLKWARPIAPGWSGGLVLAVAAPDRAPHTVATSAVLLATWQAGETLLLHVNAGRDLRHAEPGTSRAGLALEWAPLAAWSFVAERFRDGGANAWRAGARWAVTPHTNIDLSRARGLHGGPPAWWTLGLTWAWDR